MQRLNRCESGISIHSSIIIHEKYNIKDTDTPYNNENDVAIIKLKEPIEFKHYSDLGLFESTENSHLELSGTFVRPICLPRTKPINKPSRKKWKQWNRITGKTQLWATGYGKTNADSDDEVEDSDGLKHGKMSYLNKIRCEKKFDESSLGK